MLLGCLPQQTSSLFRIIAAYCPLTWLHFSKFQSFDQRCILMSEHYNLAFFIMLLYLSCGGSVELNKALSGPWSWQVCYFGLRVLWYLFMAITKTNSRGCGNKSRLSKILTVWERIVVGMWLVILLELNRW